MPILFIYILFLNKMKEEAFKKEVSNNTSINSNSDLNNTVYSSNINDSNNIFKFSSILSTSTR